MHGLHGMHGTGHGTGIAHGCGTGTGHGCGTGTAHGCGTGTQIRFSLLKKEQNKIKE